MGLEEYEYAPLAVIRYKNTRLRKERNSPWRSRVCSALFDGAGSRTESPKNVSNVSNASNASDASNVSNVSNVFNVSNIFRRLSPLERKTFDTLDIRTSFSRTRMPQWSGFPSWTQLHRKVRNRLDSFKDSFVLFLVLYFYTVLLPEERTRIPLDPLWSFIRGAYSHSSRPTVVFSRRRSREGLIPLGIFVHFPSVSLSVCESVCLWVCEQPTDFIYRPILKILFLLLS